MDKICPNFNYIYGLDKIMDKKLSKTQEKKLLKTQIYKDFCNGTRDYTLARQYSVSVKTIRRYVQEVRELNQIENKATKLVKQAITVSKSEDKRATSVIKNFMLAEYMNEERIYNMFESETAEVENLYKDRLLKLENQRQKLENKIEHDDSITSIEYAGAYEKLVNCDVKIVDLKLKISQLKKSIAEFYGFSKESKSTTNIQTNIQQNVQTGEYDSSGNYIPTTKESEAVAISFKIATNQEEYNNAVAEKLNDVVEAEYSLES